MTYKNNKWGGYNPQQDENEKKQQLLIQKQKSLHKMKVALDTFYNVLEPLEEYIEKTGNYPGFITKRQIYRKSIQDSEGSLENDEDLFLSDLYIFARTFHGKPEFFMKVIQEDFYKWINAVGITAENTSEELKHFLIEINNVLEGNDEKIIRETAERNKNVEIDPKEMVGMFAGLQNPLNENRRRRKELEGKKWNELSEEDRLKGDADLGRREFERIKRNVSVLHENFRLRYFGEKRPLQLQHLTNSQIILDIKQNPRNWRIDEVIAEYDNQGRATKKEKALIHNSAQIGYDGSVLGDNQPVYLAQMFSKAEISEINQFLNISQTPNYDNWTKEQFIAEIERLKAENEWLRNNQTLTSSEKAARVQQNQQQLQQLQSYSQSNSFKNNIPANLFIGGTLLALVGLISFLVIRKHRKNK